MYSGGTTSERQEGQWNTSSGRRRISGYPHSQGCLPVTSGKAASCRSVSRIALPRMPQDSQLARYGPRGRNSLDPHAGQTRRFGFDTVCVERTSLPSFVSTSLYLPTPRARRRDSWYFVYHSLQYSERVVSAPRRIFGRLGFTLQPVRWAHLLYAHDTSRSGDHGG
jgi:hypothetical protein